MLNVECYITIYVTKTYRMFSFSRTINELFLVAGRFPFSIGKLSNSRVTVKAENRIENW